MSNDRAERLRNRRKKTSEKVKSEKEDKPVKPDKPDKQEDDEDGVTSAKDRDDWSAIQMQLPDDLRDDLELALDETNLSLKREGEEKLQKLLHWYPLVVSAGIESIADMDIDEVYEEAKRFEKAEQTE